jgi:2'-5' RNA ligase
MRAFLAIELPDRVRTALAETVARLRKARVNASWVTPDRMHLTLRFLGDVTEDAARELAKRLRDDYRPAVPPELRVQGIGAFPKLSRPSVVWAGVVEDGHSLATAQRIAEECAQGIGLAPEPKPFHAHVTLCRVKSGQGIADLIGRMEREAGLDAGAFTARAVSLFSSELTGKGPVYTRIEEFPFR